jgi:hypothetical protein
MPLLAYTRTTPNRRTLVTETHLGSSTNQTAHAVSLDTNHANAFVAAGVETCRSPFDHCGGQMHDVFIVISEGADGDHIARTVYAASEDDARRTHHENYADEPIVAVHQ